MKSTSHLKPQEWKDKRDKLITQLRETCLSPSRITNGVTRIGLEGGAFPGYFLFGSKDLTIWGRGNRYAGRSCTIQELAEAEAVIRKWFEEEIECM